VAVVEEKQNPPDPSPATQGDLATSAKLDQTTVNQVFDYYLQKMGKNPKLYKLTPLRLEAGLARLAECRVLFADRPDLSAAEVDERCLLLLNGAVDKLAASDWHMGKNPHNMRYCDWMSHLFGSYERMEKWWNN
jgi:hypothetical protein